MKVFMKRMAALAGMLVLLAGAAQYSAFYIGGPDVDAKAAILIDAETGEVLYAENENAALPAASMTKMMTEYLVFEMIEAGELSWEEEIVVSEAAAATGGASILIKPGDRLSVKDLVAAMEVASANNAAAALAERIAGSESGFAERMNEKAREIGLSVQTRFINETGLPDKNGRESTMTASDVAALAARIVADYPEILAISSLPAYTMKHNGSVIVSTNEMLGRNPDLSFKGVDGLKTGFTTAAGYCFAGTAKRGGKRLISVVMGTAEKHDRFIETKKLFAYGFKKPYIPPVKHVGQDALKLLGFQLFAVADSSDYIHYEYSRKAIPVKY